MSPGLNTSVLHCVRAPGKIPLYVKTIMASLSNGRYIPPDPVCSSERVSLKCVKHFYLMQSTLPCCGKTLGSLFQHKTQSLRDWLEERIGRPEYPGLRWESKEKKVFRIPWKHGARHGYRENEDARLFREWSKHTGASPKDVKQHKANFRCALNSLKDIKKVEMSKIKGEDAYRLYKMLPKRSTKSSSRWIRKRGQRNVGCRKSRSRDQESANQGAPQSQFCNFGFDPTTISQNSPEIHHHPNGGFPFVAPTASGSVYAGGEFPVSSYTCDPLVKMAAENVCDEPYYFQPTQQLCINQTSGYYQPKDGYYQPKDGYYQPKDGFHHPKDGYCQPKDGYYQPKDGFDQPKDGYCQPKDGYYQPKDGYYQPKDGYYQPKDGFFQPSFPQPPYSPEFITSPLPPSPSDTGSSMGGYYVTPSPNPSIQSFQSFKSPTRQKNFPEVSEVLGEAAAAVRREDDVSGLPYNCMGGRTPPTSSVTSLSVSSPQTSASFYSGMGVSENMNDVTAKFEDFQVKNKSQVFGPNQIQNFASQDFDFMEKSLNQSKPTCFNSTADVEVPPLTPSATPPCWSPKIYGTSTTPRRHSNNDVIDEQAEVTEESLNRNPFYPDEDKDQLFDEWPTDPVWSPMQLTCAHSSETTRLPSASTLLSSASTSNSSLGSSDFFNQSLLSPANVYGN